MGRELFPGSEARNNRLQPSRVRPAEPQRYGPRRRDEQDAASWPNEMNASWRVPGCTVATGGHRLYTDGAKVSIALGYH